MFFAHLGVSKGEGCKKNDARTNTCRYKLFQQSSIHMPNPPKDSNYSQVWSKAHRRAQLSWERTGSFDFDHEIQFFPQITVQAHFAGPVPKDGNLHGGTLILNHYVFSCEFPILGLSWTSTVPTASPLKLTIGTYTYRLPQVPVKGKHRSGNI